MFAYYAVFTPLSTVAGHFIVDVWNPGNETVKNIVYALTSLINCCIPNSLISGLSSSFRGAIDNRAPEKSENAGPG